MEISVFGLNNIGGVIILDLEGFRSLPWTKSKAYLLGLMYPRLDIGILDDVSNFVIVGTVAHQNDSVTKEQINEHIFSLSELLSADGLGLDFPIRFNDDIKFFKSNGQYRKSGKAGFSVVLNSDVGKSKDGDYNSLSDRFNKYLMIQVQNVPVNMINSFIAGTIDGHSSFDKTRYLVATDIDRDEKKQNILEALLLKSSVSAEINHREGRSDSSKSDQLRYSKKSLSILSNIGLLSSKRLDDIRSRI